MSTAWPPNILLIIADDLGKDVTKVSGHGKHRTFWVSNGGITHPLPNVSLLLRNGVNFSQAWAQPACSPTRASIYTGTHPWRHGVGSPMNNPQLAESNMALPRVLPQAYACGLFGKWHLGDIHPYLPTDQGWDRHVGTLAGALTDYFSWPKVDSDDPDYPYETASPPTCNNYATTETVKQAAHWIRRLEPAVPWFATVAFHTPHDPWHEPPEGHNLPGATGAQEQFNAMVQNMDYNIGRLLGTVDHLPIPAQQLENTIIVFIGDNGSFGAIAVAEEKTEIYEGGIRVPMIVSEGRAVLQELSGGIVNPIHLDATKLNTTVPAMVHLVDLFHTITDLAGIPPAAIPTAARVDSKSLVDLCCLPAHQGEVRAFNFAQYFTTNVQLATVRNRNYKLNCQIGATPTGTPTFQLFRYVGGEIPGAEDDGLTVDLYPDALANPSSAEGLALQVLLEELHRHAADAGGMSFP